MEHKNNQIVIVTGGGRGIGRGIAHAYAAKGSHVVIAESDASTGKQTTSEILDKGGQALFLQTDVRIPAQIEKLINSTAEAFGRIDVLINNAGVSRWTSPYSLTVEEWDDILNINLRGTFLCAREAARVMRLHGGGSIVNIASTRAFMSEPNAEAYAATKGGIIALTHALAASLASDHIRVNCISPGWIETGDHNQLRPIDHDQHFSGRVGTPDDIARACLYLTAPGNEFINGTNIIIDGGMTRKMIYEP